MDRGSGSCMSEQMGSKRRDNVVKGRFGVPRKNRWTKDGTYVAAQHDGSGAVGEHTLSYGAALRFVLVNGSSVGDTLVNEGLTVEDTETSMTELMEKFGPVIAGIVAEVTDDKTLPKEERKRLQVAKAATKSDEAKLVKIADKISNLRDIVVSPPADWSVERRQNYFRCSIPKMSCLLFTQIV